MLLADYHLNALRDNIRTLLSLTHSFGVTQLLTKLFSSNLAYSIHTLYTSDTWTGLLQLETKGKKQFMTCSA